MKNDNEQNWLKEFAEFSSPEIAQTKVAPALFQKVKDRLFPSPWKVFAKVVALHTVVGLLSLAICNQFGLNPFQTQQSLTDWFMKIAGHQFCMFFCGVFFMTTTYLLANFFLNLEELESIRRHQWLQTGIIGLVSLAAFYFFGAEFVAILVILWSIGALLGGFLAIESSYRFRRHLAWS